MSPLVLVLTIITVIVIALCGVALGPCDYTKAQSAITEGHYGNNR